MDASNRVVNPIRVSLGDLLADTISSRQALMLEIAAFVIVPAFQGALAFFRGRSEITEGSRRLQDKLDPLTENNLQKP